MVWSGRGQSGRRWGVLGAGPGCGVSFPSLPPYHCRMPLSTAHSLASCPPTARPVPPLTLMSLAPQAVALHTQLHPHAPVPVLYASRREHLRQGRGALLWRHPR